MKLPKFDYGHYAAPVAMVTLVVSSAFDIYKYVVSVPYVAQAAIGSATMLILIVSLVALYFHARRLCEPCARSMPLDCSNLAQRRRVHLHFMHILDTNKKAYWAAILALIVATFFVTGWLAVIVSVFFKLAGAEIIYGSVTHKRLQPWCPWCGEKGIEVKAPSPTRTPVGSGV